MARRCWDDVIMLPKVDYVSHNLSFLVEKNKTKSGTLCSFPGKCEVKYGIQNHLAADDSFLLQKTTCQK